MFGNTNQGPLGELSGHPDAGMDKIMQSALKQMIKGMDPDVLAGLLRNVNGGTYNSSNAKPAAKTAVAPSKNTTVAAKTGAAPSKKTNQYTEQQRVAELESMRMSENSHLVDEAIASGEDPGSFALRLIKASIEQDEAANEIVAEINRLWGERSKPANTQTAAASGDEIVDDIVAEILRLRNENL